MSGTTATKEAIEAAGWRELASEIHGFNVRVPGGLSDETLAAELRKRGWCCQRIGQEWVSMRALAKRLGIAGSSLSRLVIRHDYKVPGLEVLRAPNSAKGWSRVLAVRPSQEFFQMMTVVSTERAAGEEGA